MSGDDTQRGLAGQDVLKFWDGWLSKYHMVNVSEDALARATHILQAIETLDFGFGKILDIACANGWFSQRLVKYGQVTGIDISPKGISAARQLLPDSEFLAGNFMDIEIADDSFDVAVCMEAIAYMEDQGAFFEKVARILKVNGFLLLTTPNWPLWVSQDMKRGSPATLAANHLSKNSLRQLVEPHLKVLNLTTLLPKGNKGICRITNSFKLNKLLNLIIEERTLDKAKGRMGLGSSLFVLAQKR